MALAKLTEAQKQGVREMGGERFDADRAEHLARIAGSCLFSARQFNAMAAYWKRWAKGRTPS